MNNLIGVNFKSNFLVFFPVLIEKKRILTEDIKVSFWGKIQCIYNQISIY